MILWVAVSGRLDIQWFSYKLPLLLLMWPGLMGELNKTVGQGRQGNCPQKHKFPRQWNWLPVGGKNCMQEKNWGLKKKGAPVLALHQISVKHRAYSYVAVAWHSCFNLLWTRLLAVALTGMWASRSVPCYQHTLLIQFWFPVFVAKYCAIGQFSEAGLLEWMPFVIFRARSCERSQCHFWANFLVGVASRYI